MLRFKKIAATAAMLLGLSFTSAAVVSVTPEPANAATGVSVSVCNIGGYANRGCLNRKAGGTAVGTPVIDYTADFDANEDFTKSNAPSSYISGGTVHNGENGIVGPFTNGSGLNARYDGAQLVSLPVTGLPGKCAVMANAAPGLMTVGNCGENGTYYAVSSSDYLVNVYESNQQYGSSHTSNQPVFTCGQSGTGQVHGSLSGNAGECQWTQQNAPVTTSSYQLGWYPAESTSFSTSEYSGLGITPSYVTYYNCVPGSMYQHPLNTSLISGAHAAGVGVFLKMDDRTDGNGCGVPGGLPNVANGNDNSYLKAFGTDIANLGIPIMITYDWEMNGSWYDYGNGGSLGVTPSEWIQAWNNVVTQVDSTDNGLVTWVWNPNIASGASSASPYWSSNGVTVQHVGAIGVDAYLCLGQTTGTCTQTYDANLKAGVDAIKATNPALPAFLAETGIGGINRETQLSTLVQQTKADGLTGILYFNEGSSALDSSEQAALGSAVKSANGG